MVPNFFQTTDQFSSGGGVVHACIGGVSLEELETMVPMELHIFHKCLVTVLFHSVRMCRKSVEAHELPWEGNRKKLSNPSLAGGRFGGSTMVCVPPYGHEITSLIGSFICFSE